MVGSSPPGSEVRIDTRLLFSDRRLLGCTGGQNVPARDIPRIVNLYQQGRVKLDELISARFELDSVADAFRALAAGEVARAVLVIDPSLTQPSLPHPSPAHPSLPQGGTHGA
jgi:S-(hydroxymethyl)glutathione dehydrogenase/alcohol dehydrogenase